MAPKSIDQMVAESAERRLQEKVAAMALDLRRLADRIEREAAERSRPDGKRITAAQRVSRVMHEITWAVANLNVDNMVEVAVEADTPWEDSQEGVEAS